MGKVYECIGRKANKPYFLEKVCCNIFSAEELAYCVFENAELLEKDIFTTELANWLEDECGVKKMADRMYHLLSRGADTEAYAEMLLEEFPFVGAGQRAKFLELLRGDNGGKESERRKRRGDYFLHKGRYVHALNEYESALAAISPDATDEMAEVYHNMGLARAGLFLLEQAQQDFLQAYQLDGKEEHYYYYAASMRFAMSESEYIRTVSEDVQMKEIMLKLEARMQEANAKWQEGAGAQLEKQMRDLHAGSSKQYEEWMDQTILHLKDEYRRCIQ